jgi:hypothetical protein
MGRIYIPPKVNVDIYGRVNVGAKSSVEFEYLMGVSVSDVVLFDESTEALAESGMIILPRHYSIFVGTKDGELQYKPYEYNPQRIVVSTYKGIITSIDSIG